MRVLILILPLYFSCLATQCQKDPFVPARCPVYRKPLYRAFRPPLPDSTKLSSVINLFLLNVYFGHLSGVIKEKKKRFLRFLVIICTERIPFAKLYRCFLVTGKSLSPTLFVTRYTCQHAFRAP